MHHLKKRNVNELNSAVILNHGEAVRKILETNYDAVHNQDDEGNQAAHLAVKSGSIECMKILIEYDAKMGRRNFDGLLPIGIARMCGQKEVISLLIDHYEFPRKQEQSISGPEKVILRCIHPSKLIPSQVSILNTKNFNIAISLKARSYREYF